MIACGTPEKTLKSTDAQSFSNKKARHGGLFLFSFFKKFFIFFEKTLDKL